MKPPEGAGTSASDFRQNIQEKTEEKALEENKIQSEGFVIQEKEKKKEKFPNFIDFKQQVLEKKEEIEKIEVKGGWSSKYHSYRKKHSELNWPSSPGRNYKKDGWCGFPDLLNEGLKEDEITLNSWYADLEISGTIENFKKQIENLINKFNEKENKNFNKIVFFKREISGQEILVFKKKDKEKIEESDEFINWLKEKQEFKEKLKKLGKLKEDEITVNSWIIDLEISGATKNFKKQIENLINKFNEKENKNFNKIVFFKREISGQKILVLKKKDKEKIEESDEFINWLKEKQEFKEELNKLGGPKEDEISIYSWVAGLGIVRNVENLKEKIQILIKDKFPNISLLERQINGHKSLVLKKKVKEKIEESDEFKNWLKDKQEKKEELEQLEEIQKNEITFHNWWENLKRPGIKEFFNNFIKVNFPEIEIFERQVGGKKIPALKEVDKERIEKSDVFIKWLAQKNVKKEEKEKQELENQKLEQLENFCKDKEQNRESIRELLDAMQIFGASKCVDILYKFHPEFKDLPQEKVKKVIGEYLGDFMMSRGSLDYVFHDGAAEFLSDLDFRSAAKEFFKDNCYRKLIKLKKTGYIKEESLTDIIREYEISFDSIQTNKDILREIVAEVKKYYQDIFNFAKPERFVDEIKEGVSFPNLNQKINVKELEEKKSLLIADKMGTGKSASVLMAKEYLGINKCLLLAPSNVLETWKGYLSDNPNQKGCYKTGQAPKTLFLENPKDLEQLNDDQWEYIVVSLEKMKESYLDPLKKIGFEMIVVDEIHKLKNPKGFRAQKLFDFIGERENQNQYFCALSGTPAPNKVKDFAVSIKSLYADNKKIANMDIKDLTYNIIKGHQIDLRSLLIPRMQMKEMSESLEMPEKQEIKEDIEMGEEEKIIYNSILDDDELTASEKIITLRKFLLNPNIFIKAGSKFEGSKIKKTRSLLREKFLVENESRVILYVNDYIDGVIREDGAGNSIVDKLGLPSDIKILCVHGENKEERLKIQEEFNNRESKGKEKILLLVSGQTADVGVDYTGADSLIVYNEPWSEYDLQQQIARVHRPGVDHDLKVHRLVVKDSIEEGIHEYIKLKQIAIEKVLQGIPRKELEEQILIEDEKENNLIEINNALADKYLSRQDRQTKRFGYCAELGEDRFVGKVVSTEHGPEYAENYHEMGRRSYQANLNRVSGTVLKELCRLNKQKPQDVKIADFGSGPEMLRQHINDDLRDNVYSLDINPSHFDYCDPKDENKKWFVGSIKKSPFKDGEFDYLNVSAAFHYTESLNYKENTLERLETIMEMNRVLKEGGIALLNMVYVYRFRNMDDFKSAIKHFGFEVVDDFTGQSESGDNFSSNFITLRKTEDITSNVDEILSEMTKEEKDSFKFRREKKHLINTLDIIRKFNIGDNNFKIDFNEEDKKAYQEEQAIKLEAEKLKIKYGSISSIHPAEAENLGFWITFYNNRYCTNEKDGRKSGIVYIKEKNKKF